MTITDLLHLTGDRGFDTRVIVPETGYCGAAAGVEDLLAIGQVQVETLSGDDGVRLVMQGAVEDVALVWSGGGGGDSNGISFVGNGGWWRRWHS